LVCEPGIARRAAAVGRAEDWDMLEDILAKTPVAFASKDDVAKGTDIDQRFHRGIAAATGNPYLVEMVDKQLRSRARLSVLFFRHGVFDPATDQHYQILERLRAGDGESAATLIEQHINLTRGRITHVFT
jgi:GntR family transcriptional regulator, galactonate operon transcriptional repressor